MLKYIIKRNFIDKKKVLERKKDFPMEKVHFTRKNHARIRKIQQFLLLQHSSTKQQQI